MSEVLLCAEEESLRYPTCIGLPDESLNSQPWLSVCSNAEEARQQVRVGCPAEIWVAGSDQVDAVNLAAALKREAGTGRVYLLAFKGSGSLQSRAKAAGIDGIWDGETFVKNYRLRKNPKISAPVQATSGAYVLTVIGAGGGVGKSTVATLFAYQAQAAGRKTLLVDADLQFGDLLHSSGCENVLGLDEALVAPGRLTQLMPADRQPALLSAPKRLEESELVERELPHLIETLKPRFDVIVVNTAPLWTDAHLSLLESSANSLFVIDQRPSSVRACRHALELCTRAGVAASPFLFAINRCSRNAVFSSIDVSCALQGVHVTELQNGGREVEDMLGAGRPLDLIDDQNKLALSVGSLVTEVLPASSDKPTMPQMPARKMRVMPFRRKKAACL